MSSDATPRLGLPDMPETPELYPDIVADAFARLDAFTDLYLKGQFVNTPPSSPMDGDAYLTGGTPTGAWSGYAYKIAACRDGAWTMLTPFNGLRAFVATTNAFIVYADGNWADWNSLIGAGEASVASAATCDIGAANSLFVAITGTTTITSFGSFANRMRLLRFAGALTLTHHATSLVLPSGANIVTAAGDTALFASDGSGNWRCRHYARADGRMVNMASPTFTGTTTLNGNVTIAGNTRAFSFSNSGWSGSADAYLQAGVNMGGTGAGDCFMANVPSGKAFSWAINNVSKAALASDGSFLVGTTMPGGWTGDFKAEVRSATRGLSVYQTGSASNAAFIARVDATSERFISFNYNGSEVGSITTNGSIITVNGTSDARHKNVRQNQRGLAQYIRALDVVEYDWRTGAKDYGFGLIAQQAHGALPDELRSFVVSKPADSTHDWTINQAAPGILALWGVKDLYTLVEALAARVAVLEAAHAG